MEDNFWDDYHKERGMMTNKEFFSSNAKGGFYEGMVRDENGQWVESDSTRRERENRENNRPCVCGAKTAKQCDYDGSQECGY